MKITCGGVSETGDRRHSNQDSILYIHGSMDGHIAGLFLVADGIGGLSYGAEISNFIVSEFRRWWEIDLPQIIKDGLIGDSDVNELLEQEIWDIHHGARKFGIQTKQKAGSTLSLLFLLDDRYFIKNLGDSRIYLRRKGKLKLLTNDQSIVQAVSANGRIHYKNMLTMCIGIPTIPVTNSRQGHIRCGDGFLLCSDGLYNYMEKEKMQYIFSDCSMNAQEMADCMRKSIPKGYAGDNVSAVIVRIER